MSQSVQMPALGESVTEGTVTRWLKSVGETVEVDEPLLEVATDKVDTEIPSPIAGVLEEILVSEDDTVEVGTDLARIGDGSGAGAEEPESAPTQAEEPAEEPAPAQEAPAQETPEQETPAAPAAQDEPAPAESAPAADGGREAITMPALGESVTEGTVTRWLKEIGEEIEMDEPLLEVATDKVDTEVPSPVAGTLVEIVVGEDETVEVGETLAYVGSGAPAAPAPEAPAEPAPAPAPAPAEEPAKEEPAPAAPAAPAQETPAAPAPKEEPAPAQEQPAPAATATGGGYVTPLVRKLASEKGVDLSAVSGTGVGGRIRKQDVLDAAAAAEAAQQQAAPAAPAPAAAPAKPATTPEVSPLRGTREPMTRLRKIVAARMVESLQVSAQLTTVL